MPSLLTQTELNTMYERERERLFQYRRERNANLKSLGF